MKTIYKLLMCLIAVHGAALAQVVPAATGPSTVPGGKSLEYALRYAQTVQFGQSFSTLQTATVSGATTYINASEHDPFMLEYSGGYSWTLSGPAYETGQFQRMFLSQGMNGKKWKVLLSDDASYLPQSPTVGFSGIPGIGEPIGGTTTTPTSGQTILNLNTHVIENNGIGNLELDMGKATAISFGGSSQLLRFPNGDGLDTDGVSGTATFVHSLNARNSLTANYAYENFTYPDYTVTFVTQSGLLGFQHLWTRNLSTVIAAGPQALSSTVPSVVPDSMDVTVNASLTYLMRLTSFALSYNRGTNGGSGYLIGAKVDSVAGNFTRQYGPNLTMGVTGGYQRTAGLLNNGTTQGIFGGAEGTWRLNRDLVLFANYTGTTQTSTSTLPSNALNQLLETVGFGIGYSPLPKRMR